MKSKQKVTTNYDERVFMPWSFIHTCVKAQLDLSQHEAPTLPRRLL